MAMNRSNKFNIINKIASIFTGMADITNIGVIFILKQFFPALLEKSAKFILFPFAAAATILQALLGWIQVYIDSGKDSGQIFRAIIGTLTAIAITAAVVIALGYDQASILGYQLAQLPALIFAAVIGANALIHLVTSAYYGIKTVQVKPIDSHEVSLEAKALYPVERNQYSQAMINNVLFAGLSAEATATIIAVMIYKQTQLSAGFGTATALTGNAIQLYQLFQLARQTKAEQEDVENRMPLINTATSNRQPNTNYQSYGSLLFRPVKPSIEEVPSSNPSLSSI